MLRGMSAQQWQEWLIYAELEPFDNDREEQLFGSIRHVLMNVFRNRKQRTTPFRLEDARLYFGDGGPTPKPKMDWRKMKAIAQSLTEDSRKEQKRGR